jgi:acetyltransferase-like isoleucine patch superfamily enzyme
MRLFYQALGARLGPNTFSSGILWDPGFIRIGANTIVGHGAMLIPHVIEGHRLAHYPITVGDDVTIGAHATVLAGTTIGNRAIVSLGAIVRKNSRIGPGEIWGGIPAARIGQRHEADDPAGRPEEPSRRPVEIPYRSVEPIDAARTKRLKTKE